jgi:TonB family protein
MTFFSLNSAMKFRHALAISTAFHCIVFFCIALFYSRRPTGIIVRRGVSSPELVMYRGDGKDHQPYEKERSSRKDELRVLISQWSDITTTLPAEEKANSYSASSSKSSLASRNVIGALSLRAAYLAKNEPPEYPYLARRLRQQGTVRLRIEVLPDGSVGSVSVLKSSGYPALDDAARRAAGKWRFFEEDRSAALPFPVHITQEIEFLLRAP